MQHVAVGANVAEAKPRPGTGECELCLAGEEQLCPRATEAGWVEDGGYAEFVRVPSRRYLFPLAGIDPVRAAPLADAGITSYRAVRRFSALLGMARAPSSSAAAGWANSRSNTCAC